MRIMKERPEAEIPTASMADIAFLLIIFFMVTAVFSATKGLDFALPKEEQHCAFLAGDTLQEALHDYMVKQRGK